MVLLDIPNTACVIIRRMSILIITIIMILQHPVNIPLTSNITDINIHNYGHLFYIYVLVFKKILHFQYSLIL